jgi:glycosyltransferase involved in cell wall biosynthesis
VPRPDAAILTVVSARIAGMLAALRVPYLVEIDRVQADAKAIAIVRLATNVVTPTEALARYAVQVLGAAEASVVPPGIDLPPLVDRDEAKQRLELQAGLRIVTMVDRLDRDLPLELLAEAHRKLTGVALLVASDGDRADFVQAMRATTRPSSPVIFLGARSEEEQRLAISAAHACVSLRAPRAEVVACGRRQVALDRDERFEGFEGIEIVEASATAIRAALERAIEAPRLLEDEIAVTRQQLGWEHAALQIVQLLATGSPHS